MRNLISSGLGCVIIEIQGGTVEGVNVWNNGRGQQICLRGSVKAPEMHHKELVIITSWTLEGRPRQAEKNNAR